MQHQTSEEILRKVNKALDDAGLALMATLAGDYVVVKKEALFVSPAPVVGAAAVVAPPAPAGENGNGHVAPDAATVYRTETYDREYDSHTAAAALGYSKSTITEWARVGLLDGRKRANGQWKFDGDKVDAMSPAEVREVSRRYNELTGTAEKERKERKAAKAKPAHEDYDTNDMVRMFGRSRRSFQNCAREGFFGAYKEMQGKTARWRYGRAEVDGLSRQEVLDIVRLCNSEQAGRSPSVRREHAAPDKPAYDLKEPRTRDQRGEPAWTLDEATQILGLQKPSHLRNQVARGTIGHTLSARGEILIPRSEIERKFRERRQPG